MPWAHFSNDFSLLCFTFANINKHKEIAIRTIYGDQDPQHKQRKKALARAMWAQTTFKHVRILLLKILLIFVETNP